MNDYSELNGAERQRHLKRRFAPEFLPGLFARARACAQSEAVGGSLAKRSDGPLEDRRFCELLSDRAWSRLPDEVRARFSKRLHGGESAVYSGVISELRMSRIGWWLAQFARVIGAPLPLERDGVGVPAVVCVTEDRDTTGQFWTRTYGKRSGFPQVIHSSKRFAGPTGLEEYVGCGVGMTLKLVATDTALEFHSDRYYLELPFGGPKKRRLILPRWLVPGHLTVGHHAHADGSFAFTLDLVHPVFGELMHQAGVFRDVVIPQHSSQDRS